MTPNQIARLWLAAFNAHNVKALVRLYEPNAVHCSPKLRAARPETGGRVVGRAALGKWWQDAFDRLPALQYELKSITADRQRAIIIYNRILPGEPTVAVAESFEIRGGLIAASQVFHG